MAYKIKYGIFPNPQPDAEGNTTYQVRHTPEGTMNEKVKHTLTIVLQPSHTR